MIYTDHPKFLHGSDAAESDKPEEYWQNTMSIAKANAADRTREEKMLLMRNQYVLRSCR